MNAEVNASIHTSAAAWRRLRDLVWVAPALLLTACLVVVADGALTPVSVAVVRALLLNAPDLTRDETPAADEPRVAIGLRPDWRPDVRPLPGFVAVEWFAEPNFFPPESPDLAAPPLVAFHPVLPECHSDARTVASILSAPNPHEPIRGPPASA